MQKKQVITCAIIVVIAAGGGFYGGMKYQASKVPSFARAGAAGGRFAQGAGTGTTTGTGQPQTGGFRGGAAGGAGGFVTGSILSKDSQSVTVKLADGSTKIVFVNDTTKVSKSATGSLGDLSVGTNVMVTGTANSDGSTTATAIQVR